LLADDKGLWLETLLHEWEEAPGLTFVSGTVSWDPSDALRHVPFLRIAFPLPAYRDRIQLWTQALTDNQLAADGVDIRALANAFRFSGGQIHDATATAQNLARYRDPENPVPTMDDFLAASRLQSQRKLAALARKMTPHYTWDQIVLPVDRHQQLREICNQAKHRSLVYEQWGFDKKLSLGKGLTVLFSGPSGTGKTMAADIMAGELGLDLYKIDLSMVVSKYIGETEKNLSGIFTEAATSNALLFFDEADALFGKRSEVRDSHDRYANIEVGYLLQKMEEYEGIVILATNLRKNMDDAFIRRIHSGVEFPFPSLQDRLRIWETIWPSDTPLSPDLDFDFLASRFDITGGNIRNIALAATFLAAEDGKSVGMAHLLSATRREYQKMGKVTAAEEFSHVPTPPQIQRSRGRRP